MKDLKPKSPSRISGRLEVAPRERRPFVHDTPPHAQRPENSPVGEKRRRVQGPRPVHVKSNNGRNDRRPFAHRDAQHAVGHPSRPTKMSSESKHVRRDSKSGGDTAKSTERRRKTFHSDVQDAGYGGISDLQSSRQNSSHRSDQLPTHFTTPPLMPGLLTALEDVLGPKAKPTPIQALSLKHLFDPGLSDHKPSWKQFLLASETGSGKSIAYLLPMLQHLKQSEMQRSSSASTHPSPPRTVLNPRALVLAPTHELSRQLTNSAKALLHVIKLRVMCASRANSKNASQEGNTASKMALAWHAVPSDSEKAQGDEITALDTRKTHPVDIIVGTPSRLLELVRGRLWNRDERVIDREHGTVEHDKEAHVQTRKAGTADQRMGLTNVEWVVADEADVLFGDHASCPPPHNVLMSSSFLIGIDSDFQEETRLLLEDVSAARGHPIDPSSASSSLPAGSEIDLQSHANPINYPFNFLLSSATISSALASYMDTHHQSLIRLASPNLHRLPVGLTPEYVPWTGGNRNADVEKKIKYIWTEDCNRERRGDKSARSKVLVFCNKSSKVEDLSKYLTEKGIPNIALTSTSDARKRGSNHHLHGFLKEPIKDRATTPPQGERVTSRGPDVMITTSLLSRGLDFSPIVKHVFIVDEPRNMVDFLHRAGRTGRAGQSGKVVVFGKLKGRQSGKAREMRKKVAKLAT